MCHILAFLYNQFGEYMDSMGQRGLPRVTGLTLSCVADHEALKPANNISRLSRVHLASLVCRGYRLLEILLRVLQILTITM